MKTEMGVKVDVDVKRIKTCIKVCDRFTAEVIDSDGNTVRSIEDEYVPDCSLARITGTIWSWILISRQAKSLTGRSQLSRS
ncbi:TPA: hypothetical protein U2L30_005521 [Citrobacter farmeri]|nr:hypothetical protein [Citrobacter farmeri]HEM7403055.1 hypothetical protein [Citrobacter farmeri]